MNKIKKKSIASISFILLILIILKLFHSNFNLNTSIIEVEIFNINHETIFTPETLEKSLRQKFYDQGFTNVSVKRTYPKKNGKKWWSYYTLKQTTFSKSDSHNYFKKITLNILNEQNDSFDEMLNDNLKFKNNLKNIFFDYFTDDFIDYTKKKLANELLVDAENIYSIVVYFLGKKEFYEELKKSKNQEQFIFNLRKLVLDDQAYQKNFNNKLNAFIDEYSINKKLDIRKSRLINDYNIKGSQLINLIVVLFLLISVIFFTFFYIYFSRKHE